MTLVCEPKFNSCYAEKYYSSIQYIEIEISCPAPSNTQEQYIQTDGTLRQEVISTVLRKNRAESETLGWINKVASPESNLLEPTS